MCDTVQSIKFPSPFCWAPVPGCNYLSEGTRVVGLISLPPPRSQFNTTQSHPSANQDPEEATVLRLNVFFQSWDTFPE